MQKSIHQFLQTLNHPAYEVKTYFDFKPNYRKKVLADFMSVVHLAYSYHHNRPKHWKIQYDKHFESFWMELYLCFCYFEKLGGSRVLDTFLNDTNKGRKGALANFRSYYINPKKLQEISKLLGIALTDSKARALMEKYPIPALSTLITLRKLLKYRLARFIYPFQYFLVTLLPGLMWPWKKRKAITKKQLRSIEHVLKKGDILLQRTQFRLTNATMPGFWTHVMLYCGKGKIIESVPNKVHEIDWIKAAQSDYLCILRPICKIKEINKAVFYARSKIGKPYDFNFDFLSDDGLVCSELVLKAYPYLHPKMDHYFGKQTFAPSRFIQLLKEEKLKFVLFIDYNQIENETFLSSRESLLSSHLRSRWDLLQK